LEKFAEKIEMRALDEIQPYADNARIHSPEQIQELAASIEAFGFNAPILLDKHGTIVAGHGRLEAARILGMSRVPTITLQHLSDGDRRAYTIADNKLALNSSWSVELLKTEIEYLKTIDLDLDLLGFSRMELTELIPDLFSRDREPDAEASFDSDPSWEPPLSANSAEIQPGKKLTETFLVPPFSVLDARQGYWKQRKQAWLGLGIKSEIGRGENLLQMSDTMLEPDEERRNFMRDLKENGTNAASVEGKIPGYYYKLNAGMTKEEIVDEFLASGSNIKAGTSIFDPVLCELAYRWFSPKRGVVLDPFAGGSVRGIVAAKLEREYIGIDLRKEQVDENYRQADEILADDEMDPSWICDDSRNLTEIMNERGLQADLVFSCPPYADLEVYSEDPKDLSTLEYEEFREAYSLIIYKAVQNLKNDRFACFVVGEVREKDRQGFYRNFVVDTIQAFEKAGARFYNEIVLVTSVGTLAMRAGRTFTASRKIGKTHQNVLVFCKGDPVKAVQACGEIEITLPPGLESSDDMEPRIPILSPEARIGGEL
jgi:DNA modification methylase